MTARLHSRLRFCRVPNSKSISHSTLLLLAAVASLGCETSDREQAPAVPTLEPVPSLSGINHAIFVNWDHFHKRPSSEFVVSVIVERIVVKPTKPSIGAYNDTIQFVVLKESGQFKPGDRITLTFDEHQKPFHKVLHEGERREIVLGDLDGQLRLARLKPQ